MLSVVKKPKNFYPQMTELALSFPTLSKADGVEPFDAEVLDEWACSGVCHGALFAARFILAVWSGHMGWIGKRRKGKEGTMRFPVESFWKSGPFDVVDAMSTWDNQHRAAFVEWAKAPWWP